MKPTVNSNRLLLDAKDLINLLERNQPVSVDQLDQYLRSCGAQLVLTFTNVREFAAGVTGTHDILRLLFLAQRIESLPHCYLKEGGIQEQEVISAYRAFRDGVEPEAIDPYVDRWDFTVSAEPATQVYVGYRLHDALFDQWRRGGRSFLFGKHLSRGWVDFLGNQRHLRETDLKSDKQIFAQNAKGWLDAAGLSLVGLDPEAWGEWVYADPRRCPALVFQFQILREIIRNTGDNPKDGDIPDLAYVPAIPYVEAVTMDRRMANYATQAAQRLQLLNSRIDYPSRVFRSLGSLLTANPLPLAPEAVVEQGAAP